MTWDQFTLMFNEWWSTITFIVSTIFVFYYGFFAPWYKTPFGRALIAIDLGLGVATFPTALYFVTGIQIYDSRVFTWILLVIASFVPLAVAYRIVTMWAVRHSPRMLNLREKQIQDEHHNTDK